MKLQLYFTENSTLRKTKEKLDTFA